MTNAEFSDEFDVLYNSISNNKAPGLNDYEKSVLLTKAQEILIKSYFLPKDNIEGAGFDGNQKRQYDFSSLIKTVDLAKAYNEDILTTYRCFSYTNDLHSTLFIAPKDLFLTISEVAYSNNSVLGVIPMAYDTYIKKKQNPYGLPCRRQAWRLMLGTIGVNIPITYSIPIIVDDAGTILFNLNTLMSTYDPNNEDDITGATINCTLSTGKSVAPSQTIDGNKLLLTLLIGYNDINSYPSTYLTNSYLKSKNIVFDDNRIEGLNTWITKYPSIQGSKLYTRTLDFKYIYNNNEKVKGAQIFEVVSLHNITSYILKYIKTPRPIILSDISEVGLSINNEQKASECELPANTHREILQKAVELALASYTGGLQEQLAVGKNSATDIGHLMQSSQ